MLLQDVQLEARGSFGVTSQETDPIPENTRFLNQEEYLLGKRKHVHVGPLDTYMGTPWGPRYTYHKPSRTLMASRK